MADDIAPPTLAEMREHNLAHAGVKGMKWGVRKNRDGGGTLKVRARPTYTIKERLAAQEAVKLAKKSGRPVAKDAAGFDQTRVAKLLTPSQRILNRGPNQWRAFKLYAPGFAAAVAGTAIGGPFAVAGLAASVLGTVAADSWMTYRTYFSNLRNNPVLKTEVKLSPGELKRYEGGKNLSKTLIDEHGKVVLSQHRGQRSITVFDKEGRKVGGKTEKVVPPKTSAKK